MIPVRAIPGKRLLVLLLSLPQWLFAQTSIEIKENDVLLLPGGTNMVYLKRAGYRETILTRDFNDAKPRFLDFSWEADTVYRQGSVIERWRKDRFGNQAEQIKRMQPSPWILPQPGSDLVTKRYQLALITGRHALVNPDVNRFTNQVHASIG